MNRARSILVACVRIVQSVIDVIGYVYALSFSIVFVAEFVAHLPAFVDIVMRFANGVGSPLTALISRPLHLPWPTLVPHVNVVPLVLAVVSFMVKTLFDGWCHRLRYMIRLTLTPKKRLGLRDVTQIH